MLQFGTKLGTANEKRREAVKNRIVQDGLKDWGEWVII